MIPIKNKKKNLEATIDEMRNFALNYVEKFAPSKQQLKTCLLYTSPSPRDQRGSRMPSSA